MQANIEGSDGEYLKIYVVDNNNVEHGVTFQIDSEEIVHHHQDGYPDDPEKRTWAEDESVGQARRYARYHVQQERELQTIRWDENPALIERAKDAVEELAPEEFHRYFGEFQGHLAGVDEDVDRPFPLPEPVQHSGFHLYLLDVYLDEGDTVEATSDVHFMYVDSDTQKRYVWNDDPYPERDPDARLELPSLPLAADDVCQEFLVYHLACQVRDCYLGMGVEPPEAYRILGPGRFAFTTKYSNPEKPMYERYHDFYADVDGYRPRFDFDPEELEAFDPNAAELDGGTYVDEGDDTIDEIRSAIRSHASDSGAEE